MPSRVARQPCGLGRQSDVQKEENVVSRRPRTRVSRGRLAVRAVYPPRGRGRRRKLRRRNRTRRVHEHDLDEVARIGLPLDRRQRATEDVARDGAEHHDADGP